MREYAVAAWVIFCGLSLLLLYRYRRRGWAARIIKVFHLGLLPDFDPRVLLLWGFGSLGMALLVLLWIALE